MKKIILCITLIAFSLSSNSTQAISDKTKVTGGLSVAVLSGIGAYFLNKKANTIAEELSKSSTPNASLEKKFKKYKLLTYVSAALTIAGSAACLHGTYKLLNQNKDIVAGKPYYIGSNTYLLLEEDGNCKLCDSEGNQIETQTKIPEMDDDNKWENLTDTQRKKIYEQITTGGKLLTEVQFAQFVSNIGLHVFTKLEKNPNASLTTLESFVLSFFIAESK